MNYPQWRLSAILPQLSRLSSLSTHSTGSMCSTRQEAKACTCAAPLTLSGSRSSNLRQEWVSIGGEHYTFDLYAVDVPHHQLASVIPIHAKDPDTTVALESTKLLDA